MLHLLKRHPLPVAAFFRHSLVLTYAFPQEILRPLLPPGLVLDTHGDFGFLAIAMVQTRGLRPSPLPAIFGQDFFLSGYRIFARLNNAESLRGLKILRSDTDRRLMMIFGNLLTHYNYRHCSVRFIESPERLEIAIDTPNGEADLEVRADIAHKPAPLPAGSPFASQQEARKFAGPLPYTFDYESRTNSIVMIHGVRQHWNPQPVEVEVSKLTFFARDPFCRVSPILANAFHVQAVPYRWERGVRVKLDGQ
jgi:Uncharacterized conserved protein (COG2071)